MNDKALEGVFAAIPEGLPVFAAEIDSPRAADKKQLRDALEDKMLVACGPTPALLERAALEVDADDTILVFGSVYLIGEAFRALGVTPDELRTFITHPAPV